MDRYSKPLAGIKQYSRLLDIFANGYTPDQIVSLCKQTLVCVLENPSAIDIMNYSHLIMEAINVQRLISDPWTSDNFRSCLALHRDAYAVDADAALEEYARWQPALNRGMEHYWSMLQLEQPKDALPLEDFAAEAFRNIGDLLEATIQPYLRELLSKLRLSQQQPRKNVGQIEFGKVVEALTHERRLAELMAPSPWNVPLNQWRNIAKHHDFEISRNSIMACYGKGTNVHKLVLTRTELWTLLCRIFSIGLTVKTAHTVFILDHLTELKGRMLKTPQRPDAAMFGLACDAVSQGFELTEVSVQSEYARAVLHDVTDMLPWERQFHASQFVVSLWVATNAAECQIEYRKLDGTPILITTATAADCKAVRDGLIDPREFGQRVIFRPLAKCGPPEGSQRYGENFDEMEG